MVWPYTLVNMVEKSGYTPYPWLIRALWEKVRFVNPMRGAMPMHVLWTGYVGIRLAERMFKPEKDRPSLVMAFLPSMVMHGLWDYFGFARVDTLIYGLPILMVVSILMVVVPIKRGALRIQ